MARRKDHTHEELKQLALDAAIHHLREDSAQSLSLRKIAQAVGYSPGTLINIFGSYDHLLLSVNAITLDQLANRLKQTTGEDQLSPMNQLQTFARHYLEFCQQHPYQWQLLFEHQLPGGETIPQWQQQRIDRLFAILEQALAILAPAAGAQALHEASRTIWASVHGICTLSIEDKLFADPSLDGHKMAQSLINHYVGSWLQTSTTETTSAERHIEKGNVNEHS